MVVAAEAQEHGACGLAFLEVQQLDGWLVVFPAVGRLLSDDPAWSENFRGTFLAIWRTSSLDVPRCLLQCSGDGKRGNLLVVHPEDFAQNQVVVLAERRRWLRRHERAP